MEEQVAVIFAGTRGYLDTLPVNSVGKFEQALLTALRDEKSILASVGAEKALSGETEKKLVGFLDKFSKNFVA
jgi:F-type H+-transporting ATPase subunit alpha